MTQLYKAHAHWLLQKIIIKYIINIYKIIVNTFLRIVLSVLCLFFAGAMIKAMLIPKRKSHFITDKTELNVSEFASPLLTLGVSPVSGAAHGPHSQPGSLWRPAELKQTGHREPLPAKKFSSYHSWRPIPLARAQYARERVHSFAEVSQLNEHENATSAA